MSIESTLGRTYFDVLSMLKTKTINNLVEARGSGKFEMSDQDFTTLVSLIDASFSQTGPNGVGPLTREVEKYIATLENTTSKTKKTKLNYKTK